MPLVNRAEPRWRGLCVVAAPGPSLSAAIAERCRGLPVIVVNDAWRMLPFADVLYACDAQWWDVHAGCPGFAGERWSSHGDAMRNDKRAAAAHFGLRLIRGCDGDGFSLDAGRIHYGNNGGFQALNLAGHFMGWCGRILLVGFDMRRIDGRSHFFGDHPKPLRTTARGYETWPPLFAAAAKTLPPSIEILNCTPGSALTCFPMMDLADALPATA